MALVGKICLVGVTNIFHYRLHSLSARFKCRETERETLSYKCTYVLTHQHYMMSVHPSIKIATIQMYRSRYYSVIVWYSVSVSMRLFIHCYLLWFMTEYGRMAFFIFLSVSFSICLHATSLLWCSIKYLHRFRPNANRDKWLSILYMILSSVFIHIFLLKLMAGVIILS